MEKKTVSLPPWRQAWRAAKTLFFLFAMLGSLLVFSAPSLLVALLDIVLPSALLNAFITPLSAATLVESLRTYDFHSSLFDVPLVSIARSLLILCVYSLCDGPGRSRGPYLGITMLCSMASTAYVSAKAFVFGGLTKWQRAADTAAGRREVFAMEALFMSSMVLAVAHVVVAYRTSCRERRKLLVYRIDLEAVSACKSGFDYHNSYSK